MRRVLFKVSLITAFLLAGCGGSPVTPSAVTPEPELECVETTQLAPEAVSTALEFVQAQYSYDVKRMQELVVPRLGDRIAIEAFNGPNAERVEVVQGPEVAERLQCGDSVRIALKVRVAHRKYENWHLIMLRLQPYPERWLISNIAGNYDYR